MATGIEVLFTGLMLMCLGGQDNCQEEKYQNTAWVLKAKEGSTVCGWKSNFFTTLAVQFDKGEFDVRTYGLLKCADDLDNKNKITCPLEDNLCGNPQHKVYVEVDPPPVPGSESMAPDILLPQVDDIDDRFGLVDQGKLNDPNYVPVRLYFQTGKVDSGYKWPPQNVDAGNPRKWFRSNGTVGASLPRELSDRLRVRYEQAKKLSLTCGGKPVIELTLPQGQEEGSATIINSANILSETMVNGFDDLTYLLWYYRLGTWPTMNDNACPDYKEGGGGAVVLRCMQEVKDQRCSYYDNGKAGTRMWPPTVKRRR